MKKNYILLLIVLSLSTHIFAQVNPPANVRMKLNFETGYPPRAGLIWDEDETIDHYKVFLDGEDYECFSCGYSGGTFEGYAYFGIYYSLNGLFEENVFHNCGVSAIDINGQSSDTISFDFYFSETAYSRPSNLQIVNNLDESKAYFYWDAPLFGGGPNQPIAIGYSAYLNGVWAGDTDENQFTFTNLESGKNYIAGVVTHYSDGHTDSTFYPNYSKKEFYFNELPKVAELSVNQSDGLVSWKVPNNSGSYIGGTLNDFELGLNWNWCGTQDKWLKIGDVDDDIFVNSIYSFNNWIHNDAELGDDSEAISFNHVFIENPPPYKYARFEGRNINEITQNSAFSFVAPLRGNNDAETNGGTGSMIVHYNEENGIYGVVRVDDLYNLHFDEFEMPWFSLDLTWWIRTDGGHDFSDAFNYYPKWYLVYLDDVFVDTVRSTCETFNNTNFIYQLQNLEQGTSYTLGLVAEYNVGKSQLETIDFTFSGSGIDFSVEEIVNPVSGANLGFEEVTIVVKNNGTVSQTDIPLNYSINGTIVGNEIISGPVGPGESIEYTFFELANLSSPGTTYTIEVCTALLYDEVPENNCQSIEVTNTIIGNPEINVDPGSITQTLEPGTNGSRSLAIENNGDATLYFDLSLDGVKNANDGSGLCTNNLYGGGCQIGDGLVLWDLANVNAMEIPCSGNPSWYHDYTDMAHVLQPGETYQLSVMVGNYDAYLDVWIDFNDDFELTDDEIVLNNGHLANKNTYYYFNITIPSTAPIGNHVMRARTNAWNPVTDPCAMYDMGNCLDFTATIGGSTPSYWLSADITSGTIEPGGSQEITLTFNSEGLENGTYEKTISISSNDPENPVVEVPVTLNVMDNTQPWDVTITGLVHNIVVPTEANPNIYGVPLEVGDWMGVFFENEDGNLHCGGSAMMESSGNIVVIAYGDDPTTEAKDGFGEGENFVWKLYSHINQEAYPARAWYDETMPNQGNFHNFGLSKLTSLASIYCKSYMFSEGWNSMSSYINPATPEVQQLMSPVEDDLIILQNLTSVYWPSQGVNTIGNFNTESGYAVKFEETTSFELCGPSYVENQIMLNQGWHYLPVLSGCEVNTFDLFGNIMSEIVIVQDLIGENVFWPEMNIFTLETLEPGQAYKIKLSSDALITFPVCELNYSTNTKQVSKKVTQKWGNMTLTPTTQVTALLSQSLSQFTAGDEIGAFGVNEKLYGYTIVKDIDQNSAIVLNGDDTLTPSVLDGFLEAEPVSFKLYRPSTGEEFDLVAAYNEEMNNPTGNYYASSFAAIESFSLVGIDEQNSNQIHLYPNPASGFVVVRIEGKNVSPTQISIFDSKGRLALSEVTSSTISLDISKLAAGVYQVQCQNERNVITKKLLISTVN